MRDMLARAASMRIGAAAVLGIALSTCAPDLTSSKVQCADRVPNPAPCAPVGATPRDRVAESNMVCRPLHGLRD